MRAYRFIIAGLIALLGAITPAAASCGSRPGTPNEVQIDSDGSDRLAFGFRARTHDNKMWYDISIRDGQMRDIGRDLTGWGPNVGCFGCGIKHVFDGLQPNTRYCFRVRARTEAGTQGCVSENWSGWACATTRTVGNVPPGQGPTGDPGKYVAIAANGRGVWGYALGFGTRAMAEASAIAGCGAERATCKIVAQGETACFAYVDARQGSAYWFGVGLSANERGAIDVANKGCGGGAPAGTCKLVKAAC